MYGPHPNDDLQELFQARPWQGQKPEDADIIFVALDANYSRDVDVNIIRQYHEDGVRFWKDNKKDNKKVHHPFLTEKYTGSGGKRFHQTFARMELDSSCADYLSFIELLDYPTVGSRKGANVEYNPKHLRWVDSIIRKSKITFVLSGRTSGVYPEMLKIQERYEQSGIFEWLPKSLQDSSEALPVLHKNDFTVYMPYHFSCQGKQYTMLINEQLPLMTKIIKSGIKRG